MVSDFIGINSTVSAAVIAFLGWFAGIYSILVIVNVLYDRLPDSMEIEKSETANTKKAVWVSILSSFIIVGICSKSSPLYPLNDWVDSNCFLTVGKSMLYGLVPYRDLFEQKGPLLYILHALASLVSFKTFFGVYLLEVTASAFFLFISYKTVSLYRFLSPLWIPVMATFIYSSKAFCHGGSAEELCLPLIAYGIYCGIKAIRQHSAPSAAECFVIGITSGCIFWIKYTMTGFYIGCFFAMLIIFWKKEQFISMLLKLLSIFAGLLCVSIPILGYFYTNGAIGHLFTVYFYDNIFTYSSVTSNHGMPVKLALNLLHGVSCTLRNNLWVCISCGCILLILAKVKQYRDLVFYCSSFAGLFFFVFIGGVNFSYYSFILSAFIPIGVFAIAFAVQPFIDRNKLYPALSRYSFVLIFTFSIAYAFLLTQNSYLMMTQKEELPQFKFASIINQKPDATLLNYDFLDGGFYTVAGIIPNCKSFCALNINKPEYRNIQKECIDRGKVDFVVTRDKELNNDQYSICSTASFYFEGGMRNYRLYQRKSMEHSK